MKTFALLKNGSLAIEEKFMQQNDKGQPVENATRTEIAAEQIAKFRRDQEFDAALPAELKAALGG